MLFWNRLKKRSKRMINDGQKIETLFKNLIYLDKVPANQFELEKSVWCENRQWYLRYTAFNWHSKTSNNVLYFMWTEIEFVFLFTVLLLLFVGRSYNLHFRWCRFPVNVIDTQWMHRKLRDCFFCIFLFFIWFFLLCHD